MEINKDSLEKALNRPEEKNSKDMEIGYHNGALNTLNAERFELLKMIKNVEGIMNMHIQRLKELGVKVELNNNPQ